MIRVMMMMMMMMMMMIMMMMIIKYNVDIKYNTPLAGLNKSL